MTTTQVELNRVYSQLSTNRSRDNTFTYEFVQYCRLVMARLRQGRLTNEMAGRNIARAMFLSEIDNSPAMEAITMYAGELEVPRDSKYRAKLWEQIESELAELDKQLSETRKGMN